MKDHLQTVDVVGVVEATQLGLDGLLRVLSVKTEGGTVTRPITKVYSFNQREKADSLKGEPSHDPSQKSTPSTNEKRRIP
eukprot:TCALIF_14070-PA protein Name:"Protein of unknown function" AED:0.18 eAED:0.21 QI:0/0/0/1/1/1/2/0/79